jgi:hypothetical protein
MAAHAPSREADGIMEARRATGLWELVSITRKGPVLASTDHTPSNSVVLTAIAPI